MATQTYRVGYYITKNEARDIISDAHTTHGLPLTETELGLNPTINTSDDTLGSLQGYSSSPSAFEGTRETVDDGDLGNAGSARRAEWVDFLTQMNDTINRAIDIYTNIQPEFKEAFFPEILNDRLYDVAEDFQINNVSAFLDAPRGQAERFMWNQDTASGMSWTVRNTIFLYQALLGDINYNPFPTDPGLTFIDGVLGRWSIYRVSSLLFVINRELDLREAAALAAEDFQNTVLETFGLDYDAGDVNYLLGNPNYSRFFSSTFDADTISLIPLIYNFYLTSQYFPRMNEAFELPKDRALDIILSTIANDGNFNSQPDFSRGAADNAIASSTGQDQTAAFNSAARDFILKMLIKTPIDILKGVVELADPHVAISKNIKVATGFAFNNLAQVMDTAGIPEALNTAIREGSLGALDPTLNGEDLTKLLLCLVDLGLEETLNLTADLLDGVPGNNSPVPPPNFLPNVSIDGIDFTGTISGMLMMPPSPLGIIYLLLELLKNEITNQNENVVNMSAESANANECNDNESETEET